MDAAQPIWKDRNEYEKLLASGIAGGCIDNGSAVSRPSPYRDQQLAQAACRHVCFFLLRCRYFFCAERFRDLPLGRKGGVCGRFYREPPDQDSRRILAGFFVA